MLVPLNIGLVGYDPLFVFFFKCGLKKAGLTINEVKRVDLIGKHKNSNLNLNYSFNYERLGKREKKKKGEDSYPCD